jgi:hypothetical protein
MSNSPSPNGSNGQRDSRGRFAKGNPGGPGNPHGRAVARLRSAILSAVSEKDLYDVVAALVSKAKSGDVVAARELLDRIGGKPFASLDPLRVELEEKKLELARDRLEEEAMYHMEQS